MSPLFRSESVGGQLEVDGADLAGRDAGSIFRRDHGSNVPL